MGESPLRVPNVRISSLPYAVFLTMFSFHSSKPVGITRTYLSYKTHWYYIVFHLCLFEPGPSLLRVHISLQRATGRKSSTSKFKMENITYLIFCTIYTAKLI